MTMKKILLLLAVALPLAARAQTARPPIRPVYENRSATYFDNKSLLSKMRGYISYLANTKDEAGAAKKMFDELEASDMLLEGARRFKIGGRWVFFEPFNAHADITVEVGSGDEDQKLYSTHSAGPAFKMLSISAREKIKKVCAGMPEVNYAVSITQQETDVLTDAGIFVVDAVNDAGQVFLPSFDQEEAKKQQGVDAQLAYYETHTLVYGGYANLWVCYKPMPVHFKELKLLSTIREGEVSRLDMLLTDTRDRYVMDDYRISVSSSDEDVLSISAPEVRTGPDGRATVEVKGIKAGTATVKVFFDLRDRASSARVSAESEIKVKVRR